MEKEFLDDIVKNNYKIYVKGIITGMVILGLVGIVFNLVAILAAIIF